MAEQAVAVSSKAKGLPPIGDLFSDSWELLKLSWKKLLVFNLVMIGISLALIVVVLIILGLTIGGGVYALMQGHYSPAALGGLGIGVVAGILVAIIAAITIGALNQAGSILAVNNPATSIEELLKKSFHLVVPLFLISLVTTLLAVPAFFLLLIPGLLVVFFFYFAPYGVVIGNLGVLDSLRRSIYLIKVNFWGMLARALLMVGLFIAVSFIFGLTSLASVKVPLLGVIFALLRIIVNIALSWFMISYSLTLYKQAEAAAGDKAGRGKLIWFVILAIASVIFVSLLVGTIVKSVLSNPEIKNALMNDAKSSNSSSLNSGDVMKETYKNAFVSACEQGGSTDTKYCTCIADNLINKYSTQELQDIIKKYAATKVVPQELTNAAKACMPAPSQ
jgi:hypothetical protein